MADSSPSASATRSDRPATIYEVARKAGVSIGTVSRVLNGGNKENWKSTVKRAAQVRRIAEELGYRPSWRGRAFASGKTQTIGLIHQAYDPLQMGESWHHTLRDLTNHLKADGFVVQFIPVNDEKEDMLDCRRMILERRFDGCIVSKYLLPEIEQAMLEANMPAVLVNAQGDSRWSQVHLDDRGGARALTAHLIAHGHRCIAFLTNDIGNIRHYSLNERMEGTREAMREAGLSGPIESHQPDAFSGLDELLARPEKPTAVITYHDSSAIALLQACWRKNVRVPQDLSVATFNDSSATRTSIPPLTTMRLPTEIVAHRAASLLFARMAAADPDNKTTDPWIAERLILPEELIERESTGPAPAGD